MVWVCSSERYPDRHLRFAAVAPCVVWYQANIHRFRLLMFYFTIKSLAPVARVKNMGQKAREALQTLDQAGETEGIKYLVLEKERIPEKILLKLSKTAT
ncbi:MAG: hypothetical protein JSV29_02710 [Candidatus Bathyarchaeota archaeon]|nr:MAG: hypothetical protein JSV29_02710 [Candidatus Bathyarchaeota archaeon]